MLDPKELIALIESFGSECEVAALEAHCYPGKSWEAKRAEANATLALITANIECLGKELKRLNAIASAPRGTEAQILKERELTASAISGAIAFGQQGVQPAPAGHWLQPFWTLGRNLAVGAQAPCACGAYGGPESHARWCKHAGSVGAGDAWQPPDTMPEEPGRWLQVRAIETYRFHPYKPASTEARRGLKGRWQRHNGYGFQTCEKPHGDWRDGEEKEQPR